MKSIEKVSAIIALLVVIVGFGVAWGVQQEKISNLESAQKVQGDIQKEIFSFTMSLWKIDPTVANKWSKLNWKPQVAHSGDTVKFVPWYEIKSLKYIFKYEIRKDSTGSYMFVDTMYKHKE